MRYYKLISGGYICSVGTGENIGDEITESEYIDIKNAISNMPKENGYVYRLTTGLSLEKHENAPDTDDISPDDALDIILGGLGENV